jgi:hypothetical protein
LNFVTKSYLVHCSNISVSVKLQSVNGLFPLQLLLLSSKALCSNTDKESAEYFGPMIGWNFHLWGTNDFRSSLLILFRLVVSQQVPPKASLLELFRRWLNNLLSKISRRNYKGLNFFFSPS